MNITDWVLIAIGGLALLRGLWRGAVSQVFGILGFVAGFVVAHRYGTALGLRLAETFPALPYPTAIAAGLLFGLTWFLIALAGSWISRRLHTGGLGGTDRLLGGAFGLIKGGVAMIFVVWILTFLCPPDHALIKHSRLVPYVQLGTRLLLDAAPKGFRQHLDELSRNMKKPAPGRDTKPPGAGAEKNDGAGKEQSRRAL